MLGGRSALPQFTGDEPLLSRAMKELTFLNSLTSHGVNAEALEARAALWLGHRATIKDIVAKLKLGFSTLVICEKGLVIDLASLIGELCVKEAMPATLISPAASTSAGGVSLSPLDHYRAGFIKHLDAATTGDSQVIIVHHLDLLMADASGRLDDQARNIVYLLATRRGGVLLAFADPAHPLPKVVEDQFDARIVLPPLDRRDLWRLLRPEEARLFSTDPLTVSAQLKLYQYLSGVSVLTLRRWMRLLSSLPGFQAVTHDEEAGAIYQYIRHNLTPIAGLAVPDVSTEHIQGYRALKQSLEDNLLQPMGQRQVADSHEAVQRYDALIPRGVLLYGPPGTGKTELAKYLAQRLEAVLLVVHGPELKSMWHGETERGIRRIFEQARRAAPSVILIDEIDALTGRRDPGQSNVEASAVAQFLTEMDGLRAEATVVVIGTTNRLDTVDAAFLRPGRFELRLEVDYPDDESRAAILGYYLRRYGLIDEADWDAGEGRPKDAAARSALEGLVKLTGESLLTEEERAARQRWRDALLAQQFGSSYNRLWNDAGALFQETVNAEFGLGVSRFSGDHLHGICKYLARQRNTQSGDRPFRWEDAANWQAAIAAVRATRRSEAPPRPPALDSHPVRTR